MRDPMSLLEQFQIQNAKAAIQVINIQVPGVVQSYAAVATCSHLPVTTV